MPYVSGKQRRFFHTQTAREHGITPAMVKKWDAESKAEKRGAASVSIQTPRVSSPKAPKAPSAPRSSDKPASRPLGPPEQGEVVNRFAQQDAAAAQNSSTDKLNAGQQLTMPITHD
jgi:hypothetical protein